MADKYCSIMEVTTLEEEGVLSINKNLVVKMVDHSEFEVVFIKRK